MSSLLIQAAQSAAQADGVGMASQQKKKGPPLRRGKWTPEEEAYANRLIQEFKAGLLPLTDGTTLRTFLSKLLNCDPMRISKKFVGSNCIGKQVFRRRAADLSRLTPEQIHQSRQELSELERRFLERVAQTNRVKSTGVGGGGGATAPGPEVAMAKPKTEQSTAADPPSPPWLQPPNGFQPGSHSAAFGDNRAAAAGRALLGGMGGGEAKLNRGGLSDSANLLALELQRRASQSSLLQNALHGNSSSNLFAAARQSSAGGLSNAALSQLAQNASAARLANLNSNNQSLNNLMLKTGLSRDQLSKLARDRGLSSGSLSNLLQRQNSFDALMSLDLQSLQSIDNLANLIQTNGSAHRVPEAGVKNADFVLPGAPSSGQMDSLLRNLSNNNVRSGGDSNANLNNLLQSMRSSNALNGGASSASLFGGHTQSAASLANMLRQDSSTGLSALRMQDGLTQRNSSVDDFLSLVAAGDIPHQDPTMLNIPLMQQQQQSADAARLLAHQQLLQGSGNSALANALASRSMGSMSGLSSNNNLSQTALAMAQARKRKLDGINGDIERQHGDN